MLPKPGAWAPAPLQVDLSKLLLCEGLDPASLRDCAKRPVTLEALEESQQVGLGLKGCKASLFYSRPAPCCAAPSACCGDRAAHSQPQSLESHAIGCPPLQPSQRGRLLSVQTSFVKRAVTWAGAACWAAPPGGMAGKHDVEAGAADEGAMGSSAADAAAVEMSPGMEALEVEDGLVGRAAAAIRTQQSMRRQRPQGSWPVEEKTPPAQGA